MAYQHYRSQFGDTTFRKVFVGGLAWETQTEEMRSYFQQFGEILEAVIITDKSTGRSKGYGFVTFRDPESARRACIDPNPVIDGRRTNCNIASFRRPRISPPRARNQGGSPYHGGRPLGESSYNRAAAALLSPLPPPPPPLPPPPPPPLPPPPPVIYPSYGYSTYTADYGYHQSMYHPQYYHQMYGTSPSTIGPSYYYGYAVQASRETPFSGPQGPSYLHYPAQGQGDGSFATTPTIFPPPPPPPPQLLRRPTQPTSTAESQNTQQAAQASSATEVRGP
ncbi:PREDICTED: RNA-binding protein 38-like isoform X2 [Nelumbo nucifera]|uniref:RNA-binding protein 38-like isoform X2 n=1 Tax=Nelumbo nucifera TaxID=4432 RepID=A0A1U8ASG3_NELNU|nr:PREDICTED: RNA-binding protein 38-like isoform X2 [Nelumbo nucifera]